MIAQSLHKLSQPEAAENPFPGLRPFELHESHLFFGREGQSEKLLTKLQAGHFLAIVGTSGSGKSSLVRAGLIPNLLGGMMFSAGSEWRVAILRPGNDPIGNLARALNSPEVYGSEAKENAEIQSEVTEETLRRSARGLIESVRLALRPADENLLVVVDQFEELFRFARQASVPSAVADAPESVPRTVASVADSKSLYRNDAAAFVKLLLEAVKPNADGQREANIYVVLTMRSDFLGDCSQFWDLPETITESQYLIPRLTRDQLRQVIEGPVAVGGGEIAPRLVNQLLNDIADNQDQLPILQHALMRTWDHWRETTFVVPLSGGSGCEAALPLVPSANRLKAELQTRLPIDLEHYEAIGEMANALSKHADEAYAELPDDRHRRIAERMFKALTEKGEDNREIRRPVEFDKLRAVAEATEEELQTVIETFREPGRSFLMPPAGTALEETTLVDISHESLIRVWTKLQQWTNDEAESAAIYLRLADAARRNAELWRGKDLQEGKDWLNKNKPTRVWAERYDSNFTAAMVFLHKSQRQRSKELRLARRQKREDAERTQRELRQAQALAETQQRRAEEQAVSASKLRRLAAGLVLLGLLAVVIAVVAFTQYQSAESNLVKSRNLLYITNQLLGWTAFDQHLSFRVQDSLEASFPTPDANKKDDLRSFDWYYLWRQMHYEKQTLRGHTRSVNSVAFSPDGRTLASGSWDNTLRLWDVRAHKELRKLEGHTLSISSVAFSPDGRTLASGSWDNTVRLWDVSSGMELRKLEGHTLYVKSVAFSSDGRTLASGSWDNTVRLWDVSSGMELRRLDGHKAIVSTVAFSPDGRTLASGGYDSELKLWNVSTGKELQRLVEHEVTINSVTFSPDGKTLAGSSLDNTVRVWDVKSGKELRKLQGHEDTVNSVAFSPDGRRLASGGDDQRLRLWDVESGKELHTLEGHGDSINSVSFSPDGLTLASGSSDNTLKLWNVENTEEWQKLEGHGDTVKSVVFSPDGRTLASGSLDKTVRLWNVKSGKELRKLEGHKDIVSSVSFSPDGRTLASGSWDKTVRLWDVGSSKVLRILVGHEDAVSGVVFSPDGRILASGGNDETVRLWDVGSGKELRKLGGQGGGEVHTVAFSPDGRTLAIGRNEIELRLWEVDSGKELRRLKGRASYIYSVAFSPDGQTLAGGSFNSVWLWNVGSGKELRELKRHASSVNAVAFSLDGRTLASSSNDKTLRLWDIASGRELRKLEGHSSDVNSVAFSPDGRTLASGGGGKTVKNGKATRFGDILLWRGATDEEVARQCNRCGRKE